MGATITQQAAALAATTRKLAVVTAITQNAAALADSTRILVVV